MALIMCLECKQLSALTKMAVCHGGIQPSPQLSKHWIETSPETQGRRKKKKATIVWIYVICSLRQKWFFLLFLPFPSCLPPQISEYSHMPVICVWETIPILSHPTFKESTNHIYVKSWMVTSLRVSQPIVKYAGPNGMTGCLISESPSRLKPRQSRSYWKVQLAPETSCFLSSVWTISRFSGSLCKQI